LEVQRFGILPDVNTLSGTIGTASTLPRLGENTMRDATPGCATTLKKTHPQRNQKKQHDAGSKQKLCR
jgi:hypothetical protein